jgi:hypothetical protein
MSTKIIPLERTANPASLNGTQRKVAAQVRSAKVAARDAALDLKDTQHDLFLEAVQPAAGASEDYLLAQAAPAASSYASDAGAPILPSGADAMPAAPTAPASPAFGWSGLTLGGLTLGGLGLISAGGGSVAVAAPLTPVVDPLTPIAAPLTPVVDPLTPIAAPLTPVVDSVAAVASGAILAGPVLAGNDLVVKLYRADGTTLIGTATVDDQGRYTATTDGYIGAIIARVMSAGSGVNDYMDEATGQAKDLSTVLTAVGVATASGVSLSINPLTTIAAQLAGLAADGTGAIASTSDVTAANAAVAAAFGITGSLVAPMALVPVIDASGNTNVAADTYGKVLAALSGLDQINGGSLQDAIQAFAADLSATGSLSAASKFNLVMGAQDPDLAGVAGLGATLSTIANISVDDIAQVLAQHRSDFADADLASILCTVLGSTSITADTLDAVSQVITRAAGIGEIDLSRLSEATSRFVAVSVGDVANLVETNAEVTLTLVGAGVAAGDSVIVTLSNVDILDLWTQTLTINPDGITVTLPADTLLITSEGVQTTVTVVAGNGSALSASFGVDLSAPEAFPARSALGFESGIENGYTNALSVLAPNSWGVADHWQYKVGANSTTWTNGTDFVAGRAVLTLADGAYNVDSASQIYLRGFDDAGNSSAEVNTSWQQFYMDTTAAQFTVLEDGRVQMNEPGLVVLLKDTALPDGGANALLSVFQSAHGAGNESAVFVLPETINTAVSLSIDSRFNHLTYGSYHYYAIDNAGNVTSLDSAVTIDTVTPQLVNVLADKLAVIGQDLILAINDVGPVFSDLDGNNLIYTARLVGGQPLPVGLVFDTTTDPSNPSFTATAAELQSMLVRGETLQIEVTATNAAGLVEKSASTTFTLTYDELPNTAPTLDWSIQDQVLNVGTDGSGRSQKIEFGGLAVDAENDLLTYSATLADGNLLPNWLVLLTDNNGNPYLRATPASVDVTSSPLSVTVTADDGRGGAVSDTFAITVADDGSVFYPRQAVTSFELTVDNDLLSGSATLGDASIVNLAGFSRFFGNPQTLTDTAHVVLDNSTGTTSVAPNLLLGNFAHINVDVLSVTTLGELSTWSVSEGGDFTAQDVTIHAGANLSINWMDAADSAATTLVIGGAGHVSIVGLDGTAAQHDGANAYLSSPLLTIDASTLAGDLSVSFNAAKATVSGGSGDDMIFFKGVNGWLEDPVAQITLTGGAGIDSFRIGNYANNAHVIITDFDVSNEHLDLIDTTLGGNAMVSGTSPLGSGGSFGDLIDVLVWQNGSDADVYIDINGDHSFNSNDLIVTLTGINVTDVNAGFIVHA